jgi:hypothetical protein
LDNLKVECACPGVSGARPEHQRDSIREWLKPGQLTVALNGEPVPQAEYDPIQGLQNQFVDHGAAIGEQDSLCPPRAEDVKIEK